MLNKVNDEEKNRRRRRQCLQVLHSREGRNCLAFITILTLFIHWINSSEHHQGELLHSRTGISHSAQRADDFHINPLKTASIQSNYGKRRPVRVLSMGGSTTWGAKLESRTDAYPYLIFPGSFVTNLSVRASGADYSSRCVQSMVENKLREQGIQEIENYVFDVILLEYSQNGLEGIDLLLKRLRERYPNAIIVYLHLLSPRSCLRNAKTGERPREILKTPGLKFDEMYTKINEVLSRPDAEWVFDDEQISNFVKLEDLAFHEVSKVGGLLWSLPIGPDAAGLLPLYAADRHHLSKEGHYLAAAGIRSIVEPNLPVAGPDSTVGFAKERSGSWGKGDFCYSWFESGQSPLEHTGGQMKMFVKPDKFAHHMSIGNGTATISFENIMPWEMPLSIVHMSWHPGVYPKVKVTTISKQKSDDVEAVSEPFILNPVHPREGMRSWHITLTSPVGVANPGHNTIQFDCLEKTEKPLRVTGIVLCGACS